MSLRVLLVSTDEDRRILMEAALAEAGYEVITESNQAGALKRAHDDSPDAVVVDITPGHDGAFHLLHGVRDSATGKVAEIPFVVSAGRDRAVDRIRAWESGCDAWIPRPHHMRDVLDALSGLIELAPAKRSRHRAEKFEEERRAVSGRER
jgi:DNA-binding response OmpR family regulator